MSAAENHVFDHAVKAAKLAWGPTAFALLGVPMQRALISEQVLTHLFIQDDDVSDARIRELLNDAMLRIGRWGD